MTYCPHFAFSPPINIYILLLCTYCIVLKKQTFAIRFATSEIAQEYKAEFNKAQKEMEKLLSGVDSTEGAAEADEAAKALDSLNVKAEGEAAPAAAAEEQPAEKKEEEA